MNEVGYFGSQVPAPAKSLSGDAELVLDSGEAFNGHSALLELSSTVLAEAVASGGPQPGNKSLLLPGANSAQVLILLKALYAMPATIAWADKQSPTNLQELASISHALACTGLLDIADCALVKQSGRCVTAADYIPMYRQAMQLGMDRFQTKCAEAIITSLSSIQLSKVATSDDGLVPVLRKVREQAIQKKAAQLQFMQDMYNRLDGLADNYRYTGSISTTAISIKEDLQDHFAKIKSQEEDEEVDEEVDEEELEESEEDDGYWDD